jgi:hypothetical protein
MDYPTILETFFDSPGFTAAVRTVTVSPTQPTYVVLQVHETWFPCPAHTLPQPPAGLVLQIPPVAPEDWNVAAPWQSNFEPVKAAMRAALEQALQ